MHGFSRIENLVEYSPRICADERGILFWQTEWIHAEENPAVFHYDRIRREDAGEGARATDVKNLEAATDWHGFPRRSSF